MLRTVSFFVYFVYTPLLFSCIVTKYKLHT